MPIYEYHCSNCGHDLEVIQGVKDEPLVTCPECQKKALVKLVSAAAFRLKGAGWYETDFKDSDKKKNLASSDDQPAKSESEKSEGKAESKETKSSAAQASNTSDTSNTSSTSKSGEGSQKESSSAKTENKTGKAETKAGKKDESKQQTNSKTNPSKKGGINQKE